MKLLIDDTTGRTHNLNANEACVYAAILKCTKAGRGWFANYRDLAAALPFVISASTVCRAVEKLFNLGLIERRDNALFVLLQNETSPLQNETSPLQIATEIAPPNNPLIINNEKMKENEHATCAHACDTRTPQTPSFCDLLNSYITKAKKVVTAAENREARSEWEKCSPVKKIKLLEAVKSGAWFKPRLDWLIADFPEPQPDFLRGDEDGEIVQVKYNGLFKLCRRETAQLFNLQITKIWK